MPLSRARVAAWLLACALPPRDVEVVLGDLEEEYAVRSESTGAPTLWYWGQVVRSLPVFLSLPIRRGGWGSTLGVALAAGIVQAGVELATRAAITAGLPSGSRWAPVLTSAVTLSSLMGVSFLAARIRSGAATMLTVVVLLAVALQFIVKDGRGLTLWAQLGTLWVGPSVAFAGGVLALRVLRSSSEPQQ